MALVGFAVVALKRRRLLRRRDPPRSRVCNQAVPRRRSPALWLLRGVFGRREWLALFGSAVVVTRPVRRGRPARVLAGGRRMAAHPAVPARLGLPAGPQREPTRLAATCGLRPSSDRRRPHRRPRSSPGGSFRVLRRFSSRWRLSLLGDCPPLEAGLRQLLHVRRRLLPARRLDARADRAGRYSDVRARSSTG